jgi:3-keto-5-aminohexanoate cleavage enzyme
VRSGNPIAMDKAILTCALNGVLTDPRQHPMVPVTPEAMAQSAREAFDAGASIMHVHFRSQAAGMGHLPTWEPDVAAGLTDAIRAACPGVIINQTTGIIGSDITGPKACLKHVRPEIAACNAGSLNYLKLKSDGQWAWPPILFDNPVGKVEAFLDAMRECGARPEFECFDVGIVRSVELYVQTGMTGHAHYNFVMGVASGMPADAALLELLLKYKLPDAPWQATLIGREEIWSVHRRAAELGGMLRTGLEDTFYLPGGGKAANNAALIEALAACARAAGRQIASPEETRKILKLGGGAHGEANTGVAI